MPSYSPVYSTQFIVYSDVTPNTLFYVPAGFTAVMREIDMWTALGGSYATIGIGDSIDAPIVWVAYLEQATIGATVQWQGRIMVPENGYISLDTGGLAVNDNVYVGGYLLRNLLS